MRGDKRPKRHIEHTVITGNTVDKEQLRNPIARRLVRRFDETLLGYLKFAEPTSLHDVGCGEGRVTRIVADRFHVPVRASDIDEDLIRRCRERQGDGVSFVCRSAYDLRSPEDRADVMVCCEILEHLEHPQKAMVVLRQLRARQYVFSVPREPIWRMLNVCRGRYWRALGNTPGHLNHWSKRGFLHFLSDLHFQPSRVANPLPWTMVLGAFKT